MSSEPEDWTDTHQDNIASLPVREFIKMEDEIADLQRKLDIAIKEFDALQIVCSRTLADYPLSHLTQLRIATDHARKALEEINK